MPTVSASVGGAGVTNLLAPLEQHATEKLKRLRSTGAFLRDLQSVQDKYALEGSKLLFAIPDKLQRRLLRDDPHRAQPLGRVAFGLEAFGRKHNDAKARLAKELVLAVVTPMDAFLDQQVKQTKCLLMEIAQALQSEQELNAQYQSLRSTSTSSSAKPASKQSGSNQSEHIAIFKDRKQQSQQQLKLLLKRREHERAVVKERLDELHLVEQQQLAVTNSILERVIEVYNRFIAQTTSLIVDLQATLVAQTQQQPSEKHGSESCTGDDEQSWKAFLKQCERHVAMTEWFNGFFTQLFTVEENMIKRLQAMLKLHPNSDVFTSATAIGSSGSGPALLANRDGASVPVISDLMHFHKLLTVNLMDPIGRTLRFSKQKQDKIRQELLASLDETAKLVQHTRKQVKERELKHLKLLHGSAGSAAVAPSGPHAGAHSGTATVSVTTSFSGHVADAMRINLSNFGLRSAVVTMSKTTGMQGKPRTSLTDEDDEPGSEVVLLTKRQPLTGVEKELNDARVYLLSLQRNEVEQRREIVKTLRSTSLLGIKTMELMVHDYLKHVGNALRTLKVSTDSYDAMRTASSLESSDREASELPSKWHSFIRFPTQNDDVDLKKGLDDKDDEDGPEQDYECDDSNQIDEGSGRLKRGTEQQQLRRRAAKLTWLREANLVQDPRSEVGLTSLVKSHFNSSQLSAATSSSQCGCTPLGLARLTTTKVQSMISESLERVFAHVFQSELSTQVALTVMLASIGLAAFALWLYLAHMQQSWEEIAELQRSNAVDFESMLQLLARSNQVASE